MTDVKEIKFGHHTWSSSSGQLPYDYALRHAWLDMMDEQYGDNADFAAFFADVPRGMFVESDTTKPLLSQTTMSGHLDTHERLLFAVSRAFQYLTEPSGGPGFYPTQTFVTLTLDPKENGAEHNFSAAIFNSSCTRSSHFQSVDLHGSNALAQSGFRMDSHFSQTEFRGAVQLAKLAGHPLLKHYRL